ncbi:MFS transporter [Synoicihabitans lomoniglobus]|uniref:MFS transporter n=1 Tax=Synoicihabitans lomoniglobus TaxID=2909285 RepID=A0AAF0A031_9BACT|nr:MFS transporter [Opitutaceae bacterium LMO-M01]WED64723.1 MFS transporter [Opitutaceae bacterium LMO-M01]
MKLPRPVPDQTSPDVSHGSPKGKPSRVRWRICAMLFFATTINYIDRQILGILKPELTRDLGWSEIDYSNVIFAFQLAYAGGYLFGGRLIDRIGVRLGYAAAVAGWSLAAMAHAAVRSVAGFGVVRFALGLTEGGNFPAAVKAVSEWFPRRERALATGIFNSGSSVGALVTPLVVPWITVRYGWSVAFLATGALGLVWLIAWWWIYAAPEEHPKVSAAELALIRSEPSEPTARVPWGELLRHRQTWAFIAGMFIAAPVWWFWLFWVPDFLHKSHGLNLLQLGPPLVVIYLMTDFGSIGGGWLSSHLIGRGWTVNAARKTAMLACALCVVPVIIAPVVSDLWAATLLIGLAASAHQGFAANLFTLVSDTAPRHAVSSIVGLGGAAGAIGGMLVAKVTGYVLEWTGDFRPLFAAAAGAYLVALLVIHLLSPRLTPMKLSS